MTALLLHPRSFLPQPHRPWRQPRLPNLSSRFRVSRAAKFRSWDSNAETFRSQKFGSSSRGKDGPEDEEEDEDEEFGFGKKRRRWWSDEASSGVVDDGPFGIFNELTDSIWILKVFKSYGWALPPIIVSLLLTSGPKAFLMALALPLGQSVISFAFEKIWGGTETRPKRKPRTRKRPFSGAAKKAGKKEEEEGRRNMGYQSWEDSNKSNVDETVKNSADFGGWDDLDRVRSFRQSKNQKTAMDDGKLSGRERKSDTPLFLRLLIAVFPFLGSWTKML